MGLEKTEAEVDVEAEAEEQERRQAEAEEQERRRVEDLGVGRPRMPDPTWMDLRDPARASLLGSGPRRSSMTSPLSHVSSSELNGKESLVEMMAKWKKSVEGQWGTVQEEWTQEEWEAESCLVDTGLEKMATLQMTLASQLQQHIQQHSMLIHGMGNGDAIKPNGGLVTPPSSMSQSSDSGSGSKEEGEGDDVDTDATLMSFTEDDVVGGSKHGIVCALDFVAATAAASAGGVHQAQAAARMLATPEPSMYKLSASVDSLDTSTAGSPQGKGLVTAPATCMNSQDVAGLFGLFSYCSLQ
ncbi:hypothetical protein BDZ97DRAFT_1923548 [Flammula alnicola]|nr:hypothetical protein BDZ97DRAFT_1923548 [Flammula alnicola]